MLALDQLKQIVLNNVEQTGFLDAIRAQLKGEVFKIVENQNQDIKHKAGFQWEHPIVKKIHGIEGGFLAIQLMAEMMEHFKLDYSLSVFKKELAIKEQILRENLQDDLKMKNMPESNKPMLIHVINEFIKLNENGYSGVGKHVKQKSDNYAKHHDDDNSFEKDDYYNHKSSAQEIKKETTGKTYQQLQKEKKQLEEDEEEQNMRKKLAQLEKERLERELKIQAEKEEKEKQEKQEKERREKIERDFQEREEKDRLEEEKKKKKEEDKKKKELERPKTAPVKEKKLPPTAINKIRGAGNTSALTSIYGNLLTSGTQPQPAYDPYNQGLEDEYSYPFDMTEVNGPSKTAYGGNFYGNNPQGGGYDYDISGMPQNKNQLNKFGGSSGMVDPYAAIDFGLDTKQKGGKKKSNKKDEEILDEYPSENLDEFGQSSSSYHISKDKDKKNPLFTSSEDVYGASQSQGMDMSVDSEAIDQYDYIEQVSKKKW